MTSIVVHYKELALKGKNRPWFIQLLVRNLKTALAVTNAGSGRSNASENLLPMRLLEHKWPLVFKLAHHDKDIRIAASIAHQQHAATPMLALTQHLFSASLNQLGEGADYIEVAKIVAKMNGTSWD